jgi:DNA-directed RNA polymerase subunit RPC12/RpoP
MHSDLRPPISDIRRGPMSEQVTFRCLRCGNEWRGLFDTDIERMCPKCRSNSVRRIKDKEPREPGGQTTKARGNE